MKKGAMPLAALAIALAVAVPAAGKTVLRVCTWDGGDGLKLIQKALNEFMAANPNITCKIEQTDWGVYQSKMMAQLAAGTVPDVFMIGDVDLGYFASSGFVEPISKYLKQDKVDLTDLKPSIMRQYTYSDGGIYGLPKDIAPVCAFINRDMVNQSGLNFPAKGWSWDDALMYAKKLTKLSSAGRVVRNGIQMNVSPVYTHYIVNTFGSAFLGENGRFSGALDSKATGEAIQLMSDLAPKYQVMSAWQDFVTGTVGISIEAPWSLPNLRAKKNLNYGVQVAPYKVKKATAFTSAAWAMASNGKHKREAWELLKFLGGPKGNAVMGTAGWGVPAWNSAAKALKLESSPDLGPFDDALDDAVSVCPVSKPFYSNAYYKFIEPAINQVMSRKAEAATVLAKAVDPCQKEYDRLLQRSARKKAK